MKCPLFYSLVFTLTITGLALLNRSASEQNKRETTLAISGSDERQTPNVQVHETETEEIYIADAQTAINVAVKAWIPIYGREQIESEKPYVALLKKGIWTVHGSLPKDMDGGVAFAKIRQKDGRILKIVHEQ